MTSQSPTRIAFLLDETSSMLGIKSTTISAFNEYLETLKADGQDYIFSLTAFSSIRTHALYASVPIGDVAPLTPETYLPAGSTPLIDAAMTLINAVEAKAIPGEKVIIALQTDGEENCSREFKLSDLQTKIKERSDAGWQFVFLGAGLDAYAQAAQFGISQDATVSYGKDARSTNAVFRGLASNTRLYASGGASTMDWQEQQREAAGDTYWTPDATQPTPPDADKPARLVDDIEV